MKNSKWPSMLEKLGLAYPGRANALRLQRQAIRKQLQEVRAVDHED